MHPSHRLRRARNRFRPRKIVRSSSRPRSSTSGATTSCCQRPATTNYELSQRDLENIPQGNAAQLSDIVLQFPGVSQDSTSSGDFHVRNEHANVQYRINGILLPDGVSGFSQILETSFIGNMQLLTGALPAQYGLRTAGVIDITTKSGAALSGGSVSIYGGSRQTITPSFEYGGVAGKTDYYVTGRYLSTGLGLENPIPTLNAIHDHSEQGRFFAYTSTVLDPTTRVVTISGFGATRYQIPNNPGQPGNTGGFCGGPFDPANPCLNPDGTPNANAPAYTAFGKSGFNSATLNQNQYEKNAYNVIAWQKSEGNFDAQLTYYSRYSDLHFVPDPVGDLFINNVASDVFRSSFLNGVSGDFSYRLNDAHTVRAGFYTHGEQTSIATVNTVQPLDPNDPNGLTAIDSAIQHSRPKQIVWLAARGLRPGRVAADPAAHIELRPAVRPDLPIYQCEPVQPAREPDLQTVVVDGPAHRLHADVRTATASAWSNDSNRYL